jgi:hypothetical protein
MKNKHFVRYLLFGTFRIWRDVWVQAVVRVKAVANASGFMGSRLV